MLLKTRHTLVIFCWWEIIIEEFIKKYNNKQINLDLIETKITYWFEDQLFGFLLVPDFSKKKKNYFIIIIKL